MRKYIALAFAFALLIVGSSELRAAPNSAPPPRPYIEGTCTPTDGSGAALSFTTLWCKYIKIGKVVTVTMGVTYPVTANGSTAKIAGLPFTVDTVAYGIGAMTPVTGFTASPRADINTTSVRFVTTGADATNAQFSAQNAIFTLTYFSTT